MRIDLCCDKDHDSGPQNIDAEPGNEDATPGKRKRLSNTGELTGKVAKGMIPCPHCCKTFDLTFVLRRHLEEVHGSARYYCNCCEKLFKRKDSLERHLARRTTACPGCTRRFRPDYMKRHLFGPTNELCLKAATACARREGRDSRFHDLICHLLQDVDREFVGTAPASPQTMRDHTAAVHKVESKIATDVEPIITVNVDNVTEAESTVSMPAKASWRSLKQRALKTSQRSLNSVKRQLWSRLRDGNAVQIDQAKSLCPICGSPLGQTAEQMLAHAAFHLKHRPEPSHFCITCETTFIFRNDLEHHQGEQFGDCWTCENNPSERGDSAFWALDAIRERFVQDLRLWERYQILHSLDAIIRTAHLQITPFRAISQQDPHVRWASVTSDRSLASSYSSPAKISNRRQRETMSLEFELSNMSLLEYAPSHQPASRQDLQRAGADSYSTNTQLNFLHNARQGTNSINGAGIMTLRSMLVAQNVLETSWDEDSLLLHFVGNGRSTIVEMLLQNGANAESRDSNGRTALHVACANGSNIISGHLIKAHADINARVKELNDYHGWDALMFAASRGHSTCVTQLLDYGTVISQSDAFGRTALHLVCTSTAADINLAVIVWKLIAAGFGVNDRDVLGYTPLIYAAESGKLRLVKILLEVYADTGHKTTSGHTALTAARKIGHHEVADILEPLTVSRRGQVPSLFVNSGHAASLSRIE